MPAARMDKLIWIFIFGGMIAIGLGLAVARSDDTLGWLFMVAGAVLVLAGATLIWQRSRSRSRGGR
jgi:sulfite exporter TauE/SafE